MREIVRLLRRIDKRIIVIETSGYFLCRFFVKLDMPIIDINSLKAVERLPGWRGRYFHSQHMTFAHYEFKAGASIHEHSHPQEEVYEVIDGALELTIDGKLQIAKPGVVAIIPSNARHSVKALSDGRVIVVDYPSRPEFG